MRRTYPVLATPKSARDATGLLRADSGLRGEGRMEAMEARSERVGLAAQGGYYLTTGLVPFVSRRAFEAVTGSKREWWLVQTVGALVTAIGGTLLSAVRRSRITPEIRGLAAGSAASLAAIDVVYVAKGRIAPTYLIDAAAQLVLIGGLAARATGRHVERS
jgi:hypothetical protein